MDPFEKRLKQQQLRPIPGEWRREILKSAGETESIRQPASVAEYSFLSSLNRHLVSVLWPHPVVWAGLAGIWIFIFAVNLSIQDKPAAMAEKVSPEVIGESPQQQRLYAQLMGFQLANSGDSSDSAKQKALTPRPRSGRIDFETDAML